MKLTEQMPEEDYCCKFTSIEPIGVAPTMLMSPQRGRAAMTILTKLCHASSVAVWAIAASSLASPTPASLQQAIPVTSARDAQQPDAPAKPVNPAPSPDSSGRYRVGNGVSNPKLIYLVEPELSDKLRKKKISGSCTLSITIDTDGKSQDVHIIKSFPDSSDKKLRDAAVEMQNNCTKAARQYRFEPAIYQGKPVPVELKIEISFQIF
jgi:TonB family protein